MYWLWLFIIVTAFLMTGYSIFYKDQKLKQIARDTHSIDDLVNYIDESTEKGINFAVFVITAIIILGELGVIG